MPINRGAGLILLCTYELIIIQTSWVLLSKSTQSELVARFRVIKMWSLNPNLVSPGAALAEVSLS